MLEITRHRLKEQKANIKIKKSTEEISKWIANAQCKEEIRISHILIQQFIGCVKVTSPSEIEIVYKLLPHLDVV